MSQEMPKILVAGVGNKYRGDDGFGPRVVEALMTKGLPETVEARDVGMCGVTLASDLGDYEHIIFVDAVEKGGTPGTIYRTEIKAEEVKELKSEEAKHSFTFDIHETGLEELLVYAKTIGTLPPTTTIIGCEVSEITLGESLSRPVAAAVSRVAAFILDDLQRRCERK